VEDKNYLIQKKRKKKSALKAVWVILLLAVIFIVVVVKFALAGDGDDVTAIFSGMPTNDDVYSVSKEFVLPTLKGSSAKFSDDGYQFGKKQDSVFVLRSVVETTLNSGDVLKTNFEITLRYKGGAANNQNSYELLNLNEE